MIYLEYTLRIPAENIVLVEINVVENAANDEIILVCDCIRMFNLRLSGGAQAISPDASDEIIRLCGQTRKITYAAVLGAGGKHGYQGLAKKDYGAFELCRAAALPYPKKFPSGEPLSFQCAFKVFYPDGRESFCACIDSFYSAANLRKNSVFYMHTPELSGKIRFFMQLPDQAVLARVTEIVSYFEELFGFCLRDFKLFLLNGEAEPIFGGAGAQSAAFSLRRESERDFELLAHRLFHAFFAKTPHASGYFMPPYSFIEEGYASLYELKATKRDPAESIFSMYKRYLFYYFAKPGFKISPADEASLQKSPWLIEFLHYTLAPLIMHAYGEKYRPLPAPELLGELEKAGLIKSDPLFLPEFENGYDENEAISVAELNDFEYLISSWRGGFEKTALLNNVPPPKTDLERRLDRISGSLYKLIRSAGGIH